MPYSVVILTKLSTVVLKARLMPWPRIGDAEPKVRLPGRMLERALKRPISFQ